MTNRTTQEQTRFRRLRAAYKAAFGEWSLQVRFLQAPRSCSARNSTAIQEARAQASDAQAAYRDSRDLLADFMLVRLSKIKASCGPHTSSAARTGIAGRPARDANSSGRGHKPQVECLAYFLWEGAGCPTGSAEADWYRAEQLIRSASLNTPGERGGL